MMTTNALANKDNSVLISCVQHFKKGQLERARSLFWVLGQMVLSQSDKDGNTKQSMIHVFSNVMEQYSDDLPLKLQTIIYSLPNND